MKSFSLVFFVLAVLILAGAGCYKETSTPAPEANVPMENVPITNNVVPPVNENANVPSSVNVNQPAEESPKTATVLLQNFSFSPPSVTIAAGGEVTWTNRDSANHTVTGEDWGSELFGKDQSFTKKFETPGVYPYHCVPHPNMTGRIIVK
ncbi:MAG: cupredoxin family copper-binding protein [Patescibacteria group bacterium]|jgi:plastocyanin